MKKYIPILIMVFSTDSHAQDSLVYNNLTGRFLYETKSMDHNSSIIFKIEDLNPLIYKVDIKSSNSGTSFTSGQSLFTTYFSPEPKKSDNKSKTNPIGVQQTPPPSMIGSESIHKKEGEFYESIEELKKITSLYNNLKVMCEIDKISIDELYKSKLNMVGDYCNDHDERTQGNSLANRIDASIANANTAYREVTDLLEEAGGEAANIRKTVEENKKEMDKGKFEELKNDLMKLYYQVNKNNFTFTSRPVVAKDDELKFTIEIENTKTSIKSSFEKSVYTNNDIKIDFSTGIMLTKVFDRSYLVVKDSVQRQDSNLYKHGYKIIEKDQGEFSPGLCALAHIYYRLYSWINIGLNAGVGLGLTENSQPVRYLFGGSVFLGYDKRFILNVGVAGGVIDLLQNNLSENAFYESNEPIKADTNKRFKFGLYFGITYNL